MPSRAMKIGPLAAWFLTAADSVLVTAPSALREQYRGHALTVHIAAMVATRPAGRTAEPVTAIVNIGVRGVHSWCVREPST